MVPFVRPQPAEVRRQYLQGNRRRLRDGNAESVPLEADCIEPGAAGGWEVKSITETEEDRVEAPSDLRRIHTLQCDLAVDGCQSAGIACLPLDSRG